MSESSLMLMPAPRTSYLICGILRIPLWIFSVIIPFAIVFVLMIPFFDSPIIIVPGIFAIFILVFSFVLSKTLIQWILSWVAVIWRGIRRITGAVTPAITITPNCFRLNETLTVSVESNQSDKIRKVSIQLLHRQTQVVNEGQNIGSPDSITGGVLQFLIGIVGVLNKFLPKPKVYDPDGASHKDRVLGEQILTGDRMQATFQLTQKLLPLPNYTQHMVLRVKVYSGSLLNYVEYFYLPLCT